MSDPVETGRNEDVLSSIRRLVSDQGGPRGGAASGVPRGAREGTGQGVSYRSAPEPRLSTDRAGPRRPAEARDTAQDRVETHDTPQDRGEAHDTSRREAEPHGGSADERFMLTAALRVDPSASDRRAADAADEPSEDAPLSRDAEETRALLGRMVEDEIARIVNDGDDDEDPDGTTRPDAAASTGGADARATLPADEGEPGTSTHAGSGKPALAPADRARSAPDAVRPGVSATAETGASDTGMPDDEARDPHAGVANLPGRSAARMPRDAAGPDASALGAAGAPDASAPGAVAPDAPCDPEPLTLSPATRITTGVTEDTPLHGPDGPQDADPDDAGPRPPLSALSQDAADGQSDRRPALHEPRHDAEADITEAAGAGTAGESAWPPAETGNSDDGAPRAAPSGDVAGHAPLDEAALRALVADVVRSELRGPLGERITRNVRKLVRREIHRVLLSREFD